MVRFGQPFTCPACRISYVAGQDVEIREAYEVAGGGTIYELLTSDLPPSD
jgi:hypothetical protein